METPKPKRLRFELSADGLGGVLRAPWTTQALLAFAALWNLGFFFVVGMSKNPSFAPGALIVAGIFALFFLRGVVNRTTMRFVDGRFECVRGPIFPTKVVRHEIADIARIGYQPKKDGPTEGHDFFLETRSGANVELPIRVDGIVFTLRLLATSSLVGAAPPSHAEYVCVALDRALEEARHRGGSYRIAPGSESEIASDEPETEHAVRRRR